MTVELFTVPRVRNSINKRHNVQHDNGTLQCLSSQNPLNKRHSGQRDSEIPNMTVEIFPVPQVTAPLKKK